MIANEAQWVLAIAMLAANLLWVGLRGRSLLEHYLPDSALSHLSLMWGSTVSGAAALYVEQEPALRVELSLRLESHSHHSVG